LTTIFIWAWLDSNTMVGTFVPHQVLAATEKETWKKKKKYSIFHKKENKIIIIKSNKNTFL